MNKEWFEERRKERQMQRKEERKAKLHQQRIALAEERKCIYEASMTQILDSYKESLVCSEWN